MKLTGKIIITGKLTTLTGLHIGGSKTSLSIGSIDNNVIKTAKGVPYIPGSSIKGKMRSLLAKINGSLFFSKKERNDTIGQLKEAMDKAKANSSEQDQFKHFQSVIDKSKTDEDIEYIMELFGYSGDNTKESKVMMNRLLVRDAFLQNEKDPIFQEAFTHSKWENVIDRKKGTAINPRQQERVPVGAAFGLELVYNIYEQDQSKFDQHIQAILIALELLQDDGIGGSISRGYGKVDVEIESVVYKDINLDNMSYEAMEPTGETQILLSQFNSKLS